MTLNAAQQSAIRSIAESGDGVAIRKATARALERRGFVTITGNAYMAPGVTCALTDAGKVEAIRLWRAYHEERVANGLTSKIAPRIIERIEGTR